MGDALPELGRGRELGIGMEWIEVTGQSSEIDDIGFGHRSGRGFHYLPH